MHKEIGPQERYSIYFKQGFKALKCAGFHPTYNTETDPEKRYRRAKESITKGFTKSDYKSLSLEEIEEWESAGGWLGWLLPVGMMALDAEDKETIRYIKNLCKQRGITPPEHNTNKGKHFFFKMKKGINGDPDTYMKSGHKITYRAGGKNYLILSPTNGRTWEVFFNELSE